MQRCHIGLLEPVGVVQVSVTGRAWYVAHFKRVLMYHELQITNYSQGSCGIIAMNFI
jgi:hypothetical protein